MTKRFFTLCMAFLVVVLVLSAAASLCYGMPQDRREFVHNTYDKIIETSIEHDDLIQYCIDHEVRSKEIINQAKASLSSIIYALNYLTAYAIGADDMSLDAVERQVKLMDVNMQIFRELVEAEKERRKQKT